MATTLTVKDAKKRTMVNARGAKSREKNKMLYLYVCQVAGCSYTNPCHASNFKKHVEKEHPTVEYSPNLKTKVSKTEYEATRNS